MITTESEQKSTTLLSCLALLRSHKSLTSTSVWATWWLRTVILCCTPENSLISHLAAGLSTSARKLVVLKKRTGSAKSLWRAILRPKPHLSKTKKSFSSKKTFQSGKSKKTNSVKRRTQSTTPTQPIEWCYQKKRRRLNILPKNPPILLIKSGKRLDA